MQISEVLNHIKEQYIKCNFGTPDRLVEATATSEVFDISEMASVEPDFEMKTFEGKYYYMTSETIDTLSLPFPNNIVKTGKRQLQLGNTLFELENYVHISELTPYEFIGSITCIAEAKKQPTITDVTEFRIQNNKLILINRNGETNNDIAEAFTVIHRALHTINNIPKHTVISYTPHTYKAEYYRRKSAPTIKITNRPIYYITEQKDRKETFKPRNVDLSKGRLSCEYSFKVRGHWRTLHNPKTIGVDRNGQRTIKGFTWIKEYMKGDGELIKRVRIIK